MAIVATGLSAAGCGPVTAPAPKALKLEGRTMGTAYHVTIAGARVSREKTAALHAEIDSLLAGVNKKMSTYDPESELSRFNRSRETRPFPVSPETARVVASALEFARSSNGAFDPTVAPLVNLWGFGPPDKSVEVPPAAQIAAALKTVDHESLAVVEGPALRKSNPLLQLDLSAIAKGFGVDAVGELLSSEGFTDYMVEIGGEVVARGKNPDGEAWKLGVDRPGDHAAPGAALSAVVPLADAGLATSGNYRNFFMKEGKRYSHFIDPRTGRPVTHLLASASVIAPSCMEADAAATAVMVLGPEKGLAWVKTRGYEALLLVGNPDGTFDELKTSRFPIWGE